MYQQNQFISSYVCSYVAINNMYYVYTWLASQLAGMFQGLPRISRLGKFILQFVPKSRKEK